MANKKTVSIISGVVLRRALGITAKNLDDRNVQRDKTSSGVLGYDFDEVVSKCGDLIYSKLGAKYSNHSGDLDELKLAKLVEETRKLKIDNDTQEGLLVPASDVYVAYSKRIKAMCDILDAIPSRVKMENPDVSPALLDSVNRCLIEARNKAADWNGEC